MYEKNNNMTSTLEIFIWLIFIVSRLFWMSEMVTNTVYNFI